MSVCLSVGLSVCLSKKICPNYLNVRILGKYRLLLLLLKTPYPPLPSPTLPSPPLTSPPLTSSKLTITLTASGVGGGLHSLYFIYTPAPIRASRPTNYTYIRTNTPVVIKLHKGKVFRYYRQLHFHWMLIVFVYTYVYQ